MVSEKPAQGQDQKRRHKKSRMINAQQYESGGSLNLVAKKNELRTKLSNEDELDESALTGK